MPNKIMHTDRKMPGKRGQLYTLRTRSFEHKPPFYSRNSDQLRIRVIVKQSQECYYSKGKEANYAGK